MDVLKVKLVGGAKVTQMAFVIWHLTLFMCFLVISEGNWSVCFKFTKITFEVFRITMTQHVNG